MKHIYHISNTDITYDNRICKELKAIDGIFNLPVAVFGISESDNSSISQIGSVTHFSVQLFLRKLSFLPRPVRYFFELIEFTFRAVLQGVKLKPHLVHCHDTFALPAGWLLKLIYKSKLVYDAHELESNKNGQNFLLSFATLIIEKFCWKNLDLLISVSDSILEWYLAKFGIVKHVLILNSPELIQEHSYSSLYCDKYFHKRFNIEDGKMVFVYLGIFGYGRGIEAILEAFTSPPVDAHVVFIGSGVLSSQIEFYALQHPNIHLHTPVPHEHVVSLVRHADYGLCFIENVSLSDYYCLPNKLFEYVFAGLSVLACDFPEIKKVVTRYSLGSCCAPNVENIRAVVNAVIEKGVKRPDRDLNALAWSAQAHRLQAAYSEII